MRLITIISIISLICTKNLQSNDCSVFFKEIGVKDFQLGIKYKAINLDFKTKPEEKKLPNGNEILIYKEEINLLDKERIVVYEFTLKDDKLISYTFKIRIENNEYGLNYFDRVLKKLQKSNNNEFMKKDQYAFMETNKNCKKFFRFCQLDFNNYIYGGLSYTNSN